MSKKINIAAISSAVIFILIAVFTVSGRLDSLNNSLSDAVHSLETPAMTAVLKTITNISEWFVYIPVALLLTAIPKLRWKAGLPAALTLTVSAVFNAILKLCFAIPRPDTHRLISATGFGFPSGHAMNGTAFTGICVLLFARYSTNRKSKTAMSILATFFMLAVGFSRIYLGVHNPTDIMAGYAMGLFLCLFTICVINKLQKQKTHNDSYQ